MFDIKEHQKEGHQAHYQCAETGQNFTKELKQCDV